MQSISPKRSHRRRNRLSAPVLVLLAIAASGLQAADDRDLVLSSGESPNLFIILDTSGSMNWDVDDLALPYRFEDTNSKAYIAKSAVYDVVSSLDERARVGFAHFATPNPKAYQKRFVYKLDPAQDTDDLPWYDQVEWPRHGTPIQFGGSSGADMGSCSNGHTRQNADDRLGKMGWNGNDTTHLFIASGSNTYDFELKGLDNSEELGPAIEVKVKVKTCGGNAFGTETLRFVPFQDVDSSGRTVTRADYVSSYGHGKPCDGWEDNSGDGDGPTSYTTFPDPLGRGTFSGVSPLDRGDMLPWDWKSWGDDPDTPPAGFELSNRDEFLRRLAPNIFENGQLDLGVDPLLRMGPYFENQPNGGHLKLRPQYEDTPPFGFANLTPLGASLRDLLAWYQTWKPLAQDPEDGDPAFDCRKKYVILVTDGADTCDGGAPLAAAGLLAEGVRTFVIGFGNVGASALQGIADSGGTGQLDTITDDAYGMDCQSFNYKEETAPGVEVEKNLCPGPVIADDEERLRNALLGILESIGTGRGAFSSPSVPLEQVDSRDFIFVPSFIPLAKAPYWKGRLAAFRRPLEFVEDDDGNMIPYEGNVCSTGDSGCFAWEAGGELLEIMPTGLEAAAGDYKIGYEANQRRVVWGFEPLAGGIPWQQELLLPDPADEAVRQELWGQLGIPHDPATVMTDPVPLNLASALVGDILRQRSGENRDGIDETFGLGDIFHSSPTFVGSPSQLEYIAANLFGTPGEACWIDGDFNNDARGYRCYWQRQRYRRHIVLAGSNDGMVHAFDAGRLKSTGVQSLGELEFTYGTGKELFAYMPNAMLQTAEERLVERSSKHDWGVDGQIAANIDAFVDPAFGVAPDPDEREWRSFAIGGMRRGGKGYWALDITNPDPTSQHSNLDAMVPPDQTATDYVPACAVPGLTGCGPLPYPAVRWEFSDLGPDGLPRNENAPGLTDDPSLEDEAPDLAFTWSKPAFGRVRIGDGRFVAMFGGGLDDDPDNQDAGRTFYMVDIETGKAVYKRHLRGQVPGTPSALDANGDGYIDTVYFGTRNGFLYKIDLRETVDLVVDANTGDERVPTDEWRAFEIFDTDGRPIFYSPNAVWMANRQKYAVAFGTGDRADLWSEQPEGRFYVFTDTGFTADTMTSPWTEVALHPIAPDDGDGDDLLQQSMPNTDLPGYYIVMQENERLISKPFTLTGLTVFTTFVPNQVVEDGECKNAGVSHLYTFFTGSGNALTDRDGDHDRYRAVEGFVSDPFAEYTSTTGVDVAPDPDTEVSLQEIEQKLKDLMPRNCRFPNVSINLKAQRSDTGMEYLARVPVCVEQRDWKQWYGR